MASGQNIDMSENIIQDRLPCQQIQAESIEHDLSIHARRIILCLEIAILELKKMQFHRHEDLGSSFDIYMVSTKTCASVDLNDQYHLPTFLDIDDFIEKMHKLKILTNYKLNNFSMQERFSKKNLRQTSNENLLLFAAIKDLKLRLLEEQKRLNDIFSQGYSLLKRLNEKVAILREKLSISNEMISHESKMTIEPKYMKNGKRNLADYTEKEKLTNQFCITVNDHLQEENKLRNRKIENETNLKYWMSKYDRDISEKFDEFEKLLDEYHSEYRALTDLKKMIHEQKKEYKFSMEEKQREEERLYKEMAYRLLTNRSARIIQRTWRAYREKKSRRKGKKGKDVKRIQSRK